MTLILSMKIADAIVVAADCRITRTFDMNAIKYSGIQSDSEQKIFAVNDRIALTYCGNANISGIPTSYHLRKAIRSFSNINTTKDIAVALIEYWEKNKIKNRPNILISGYNSDLTQSIIELRGINNEIVVRHTQDETYGIVYHGETDIAEKLFEGRKYDFSLFRLQDAMELIDILITTTARIQSLSVCEKTVSTKYDLLYITEDGIRWVKKQEFAI